MKKYYVIEYTHIGTSGIYGIAPREYNHGVFYTKEDAESYMDEATGELESNPNSLGHYNYGDNNQYHYLLSKEVEEPPVKVSEWILELQKHLEKYGDMPLEVEDSNGFIIEPYDLDICFDACSEKPSLIMMCAFENE